jgi:hypothetical protein
MHPSKCSSIRHVLIFDLTFFIKLNSCSVIRTANINGINKECFLISGNYFHHTERHVCRLHKTHRQSTCSPQVENPWPKLCTFKQGKFSLQVWTLLEELEAPPIKLGRLITWKFTSQLLCLENSLYNKITCMHFQGPFTSSMNWACTHFKGLL